MWIKIKMNSCFYPREWQNFWKAIKLFLARKDLGKMIFIHCQWVCELICGKVLLKKLQKINEKKNCHSVALNIFGSLSLFPLLSSLYFSSLSYFIFLSPSFLYQLFYITEPIQQKYIYRGKIATLFAQYLAKLKP